MTATTIIGGVVVGFGTIFLFLGGLGILRLPDVYNRLQAGTKCTTLGAVCTIVGVGIIEPGWLCKAVVVALFILLTNPISAHALARASYKSAVPLCEGTVVDKYREFGECEEAGSTAETADATAGSEP
ncbi:MAG: cation:proton antiporter [Planctomycetes bacterium DG_20]|nr:MAG: cation:proton antiporter [Planctomycetes bacterium DG_20]